MTDPATSSMPNISVKAVSRDRVDVTVEKSDGFLVTYQVRREPTVKTLKRLARLAPGGASSA